LCGIEQLLSSTPAKLRLSFLPEIDYCPMQTATTLVCPKCGRPNPEKLRDQTDPMTGFFTPPSYALKPITSVFHCECGLSFTDTATTAEAREIVDHIEIHTLEALAHQLHLKIGRLVDDPNCQIVGFEGEAYIAEIRQLANHCETAGLPVIAERLHQLGRDVMRRWAG